MNKRRSDYEGKTVQKECGGREGKPGKRRREEVDFDNDERSGKEKE